MAPSSKGGIEKQALSHKGSEEKVKFDDLENHKVSNSVLKQKVDMLRGQAIVNMNKVHMKVPEKWTSPHEPYERSRRMAASIPKDHHVDRELQLSIGTWAAGDTTSGIGSQTWQSGNKARKLGPA